MVILDNLSLIIISYVIIALVLIFVVLGLIKKRRTNSFKVELEELDRKKNEIESAPVISELAKIETIVKNDKMEEKYKAWLNSFENVKNEIIPKINDMIIDLDIYLDKKNIKNIFLKLLRQSLLFIKLKR